MEYQKFLLRDVGDIVSGATPKTTIVENFGGDIPWLTPADLSGYTQKYISHGARNLTKQGYDSCSTQIMPSGTVLFSSRAPIGYVAIAKNPICTNQGFKSIVPKPFINSEFLYYQLIYLRKTIQDMGSGTTFKEISATKFGTVQVAVPPLVEQKRIVTRIEELFSQLDASVAELKTAKERLKVYRQAVLKKAFAKYHTFTSLKQVSERIFDGPFGSNLKTSDYVEQGIRVVRLENLKNAWFDDTKRSFVTREKYQTISSHTVYPDDLIMSTFISENIKICQLPKEVGFAVNKADCVGIRLKSGINPRFIMFYLASQEAYNLLVHQVHGATRPRVNTKQIKAMQVPVTKLCEQDATVTGIEEKMSICDSIEKTVDTALQQAEALRQSVLKKAFEGGL